MPEREIAASIYILNLLQPRGSSQWLALFKTPQSSWGYSRRIFACIVYQAFHWALLLEKEASAELDSVKTEEVEIFEEDTFFDLTSCPSRTPPCSSPLEKGRRRCIELITLNNTLVFARRLDHRKAPMPYDVAISINYLGGPKGRLPRRYIFWTCSNHGPPRNDEDFKPPQSSWGYSRRIFACIIYQAFHWVLLLAKEASAELDSVKTEEVEIFEEDTFFDLTSCPSRTPPCSSPLEKGRRRCIELITLNNTLVFARRLDHRKAPMPYDVAISINYLGGPKGRLPRRYTP